MKCDKILKTHSDSTGGLLSHLEKHQINFRKKNQSNKSSTSASVSVKPTQSCEETSEHQHKKVKISHYLHDANENSLEACLSRMTACNDLPFAVFCTSEDLRVGLSARGFNNIPKSFNTIRRRDT